MVSTVANDSEAQVRQPLLSDCDYPVEKSSSILQQDDIELRVGNSHAKSMRGKTVKVMTKGLKAISVLLIAYLAVNGFWALVRPDLYAKHANPLTLAHDETAYSQYMPHFPKFPGEPDYEHTPGHGPHHGPHRGPCGPPPPHGPGGPPPPPPHGPGGPPPPPPHGPGSPPPPPPHGPGGAPRGPPGGAPRGPPGGPGRGPGGPPRGPPGGPGRGPGGPGRGPGGPGRGPGGPGRGPGGPGRGPGGPGRGPGGPPRGPPGGPHDGPGDGPDDVYFGSARGRAGQHARFAEAPRSEEATGSAGEYANYDGSGTDYKQLSTSSTPSNAKKYLPNHVWSCAKLTPGKVLTVSAPIEWRGQHVQVGPSFAGSEVTFVWDGKVGTPPPKEINMYRRDDHHGPPPKVPKTPRPWNFGPESVPHKKPSILNDPTREYTFNNWTAVFELKIPAAPVWAKAKIDPEDVRICSLRELDMTGIGFFTKDGIPPKHGVHTAGFDEISTKFKTVVHLPSDFTRVPMRAGAPPPPAPEAKKTSSASTSASSLTVGKTASNSSSTATKASMVAEIIEVKGNNKDEVKDSKSAKNLA